MALCHHTLSLLLLVPLLIAFWPLIHSIAARVLAHHLLSLHTVVAYVLTPGSWSSHFLTLSPRSCCLVLMLPLPLHAPVSCLHSPLPRRSCHVPLSLSSSRSQVPRLKSAAALRFRAQAVVTSPPGLLTCSPRAAFLFSSVKTCYVDSFPKPGPEKGTGATK